jgi:hypothetical protein
LLFDGEPHQISMSWTNTDGRLQLHVDGEQEFERTGIATGASLASGGTLIFGQEQDSLNGGFDTAQYFGGSYQDVRVFDHVRNQAEINDNLLVDIDPDTSGLVANWRMNDLDAGRTTDALGSGNDLTVVVARGITAGVAPRQATVLLENAADGTVVATVTGADPDLAETLIYSLVDDAGGRFTINAATGEITVADGTLLDVESAASHAVTVRVTDADGLAYDETFTLDLTDVNEGPTSLTLLGHATTTASSASGLNGSIVPAAWGDVMTLQAFGRDGSNAALGYEANGAGFGVAGVRSHQRDYDFDGTTASSEMLHVDFALAQTKVDIVLSRMYPSEGGLG